MKRYSNYFWICTLTAIAAAICAFIMADEGHPTASAVLAVVAFIAWYAGIMAPDHEKYKDDTSGMTDEAIREKWGK